MAQLLKTLQGVLTIIGIQRVRQRVAEHPLIVIKLVQTLLKAAVEAALDLRQLALPLLIIIFNSSASWTKK